MTQPPRFTLEFGQGWKELPGRPGARYLIPTETADDDQGVDVSHWVEIGATTDIPEAFTRRPRGN